VPQGSGAAAVGRRRPRHRQGRGATGDAAALFVALAVLGMLAVSGWYTASGASAVALMLAR
jgi:hypothetical protein